MLTTPINAAEAIIEAFFDETLSELPKWRIDPTGAEGLSVRQKWAFVQFDWQGPAADAGVPALRLSRDCDRDCSDYDSIILSLAAPPGCRVGLIARTDAGERRILGTPFAHQKREIALPLGGARRILALTIEIHADPARSPGAVCGWLNWIGLQHGALLERHLRQVARFDERWEGYLKPETHVPDFEPRYGLLLTGEELAEARAAMEKSGGPHSSPLWELAEDARRLSPEAMAGDYVNFWNDTRFSRERDTGRILLTHGANAAQAAVLFRDPALGRLAARYAIALAHCTRWDPSFLSWMPGCKWEHRAFVPSLVMYDCALILDLCGEWFTDYGRELILRRLAEEGQGTNTYNTWWYDYIFNCNQAAWFLPGRMLAYLVLERTMPAHRENGAKTARARVVPYTDLALADLFENLGNILLPDGGYTEGPMYFAFTAGQAMLSFYLYARARGSRAREMAPAAFAATARMAEVLVSTADEAPMILVCDAIYIPQDGAAFLAWLMPTSHWVTVFRKSVAITGQPLSLLARNLSREIPAEGPPLPAFVEMPVIGQMASHRRLGGEWVKLFLMGNKAGASHTHEDKGSFVLEFAGDTFARDFGMCDYSNPLGDLMKHCERHNMLVPLAEGGVRPAPRNPIAADITPRGRGDDTAFHAAMDLAAGWEGWFSRWTRTWDSPTPGRLTITDDWAVTRGTGAVFYWTTALPIALDAGKRQAVIEGRRGRAILKWEEGVEAAYEELPLEDPVWREVARQRKEQFLVSTRLPARQPRLSLTQRGTSGIFRIVVIIEVK